MTNVIKVKTPGYGPKCPNHGVTLEDLGFPMRAKGEGTCPVSGARFAYEVDLDEEKAKTVVDKDGNVNKVGEWKVVGED